MIFFIKNILLFIYYTLYLLISKGNEKSKKISTAVGVAYLLNSLYNLNVIQI